MVRGGGCEGWEMVRGGCEGWKMERSGWWWSDDMFGGVPYTIE